MINAVVVCAWGTMGDVAPFIAYARELAGRGWHVLACSNTCYETDFADAGAAFQAVAPKDPPLRGRDDRAFLRDVRRVHDPSTKSAVLSLARSHKIALVLSRAGNRSARRVAMRLDVPHTEVALSPAYLEQNQRGRRWATLWRTFSRTSVDWPGDNRHRMLIACPAWFTPPGILEAGTVCVGFPPPPSGRLASDVERFLERQEQPLLFCFGSAEGRVDDRVVVAADVAYRLSKPALIVDTEATGTATLRPDVLVSPFVPLDRVLPRCVAFVHHAGIGSIARAVEAQCPSVFCPQRYDQPYNATIGEELGFGRVLSPSQWTSGCVTDAVAAVVRDRRTRRCLSHFGIRIEAEDGVRTAIDTMLEHVASCA